VGNSGPCLKRSDRIGDPGNLQAAAVLIIRPRMKHGCDWIALPVTSAFAETVLEVVLRRIDSGGGYVGIQFQVASR